MLTDAEAKAARESRKQLAAMRCKCAEKCAVNACAWCDAMQPNCLLEMAPDAEGGNWLGCAGGCER